MARAKANAKTSAAPAVTASPVTGADKSSQTSKQDRMKRFKELCLQRNEARNANRNEVIAEDERNKTSEHEVRKRQNAQKKLDEQVKRREAELSGVDYDREFCLNTDAVTSQRWHQKSQKAEKDKFEDFRTGGVRQFERGVAKLKPDLEKYQRRKIQAAIGDASSSIKTYGVDGEYDKEDLDRLTKAMDERAEKKMTRNRRKEFFSEADVDYINTQNERFNSKLRKAYDPYTREIKSNLERGTAL